MKSKMTERGQITVPKALRERLGLREGDELEFEEQEGTILLRRIHVTDPMRGLLGMLKNPVDVDGYLSQTRGAVWSTEEDSSGK